MRKRKRLPSRWARKLLKKQDGKCAVADCGTVLVLGPRGQHVNFIDEHIVARELGGKDTLRNRELRCWHCAKFKTYGSKATTAGSDIGNIAKVRRIRRGKMTAVKRTKRRPKYAPNYAWPKGRKMPSRPFSMVQRSMRQKT